MGVERKARALGDIAKQDVPETVDLWPGLRSRVEPRSRRGHVGAARGRSSRLSLVLAATVVFALAIGGAMMLNQPAPVSAEAILARAQAAADDPTSPRAYHLKTTSQTGAKASQTAIQETWSDGTRTRRNILIQDESGVTVAFFEVIYDGTQSWSVSTANGQVSVVHSSGANLKERAEGMGPQSSLADFLALYNNDKSCMSAKLDGEGVVAGRPTYRVAVEPNLSGCQAAAANAVAAEPSGEKPPKAETGELSDADRDLKAKMALKQFVLWIDKETYLPLKTATITQSGAVLDETEAMSVEYDLAIPDSVFAYTPPAGANVYEYPDKPGVEGLRK